MRISEAAQSFFTTFLLFAGLLVLLTGVSTSTGNAGDHTLHIEGEGMQFSRSTAVTFGDPDASAKRALRLLSTSPARTTVGIERESRVEVTASGRSCKGSPSLVLRASGDPVLRTTLSGGWRRYGSGGTLPAGRYKISVSMPRDATTRTCSRHIRLDDIRFVPVRTSPTPETTTPQSPTPVSDGAEQPSLRAPVGVNLAGAEFGENMPGEYGRDYTYPSASEVSYYASKGVEVIRLPFRWERVQRTPGGALNQAELARLDGVVAAAKENGIGVILDCHNYGRYRTGGQEYIIGSDRVTEAHFADLWRKLGDHYSDETAVYAYGLMNEPHDMGGRNVWPDAAQAATDAIRTEDTDTRVMVAGDSWSTARFWRDNNENLRIEDPSDLIVYEAHIYFEDGYTGNYDESYEGEGAYPEIGADRLEPFVKWLEENDYEGFVGEYGVPADDPRWLTVMDNTLSYMERNDLGGAYWAGGPWWGSYPLSIEPSNGKDRPQMDLLEEYFAP